VPKHLLDGLWSASPDAVTVTPVLTLDLPLTTSAIFLDFDGTLTELAARPDAVVIAPGLPETLRRLSGALNGALAIVSGRPVAEIDHYLYPTVLPVAGVHGAERRGSDGHLRRMAAPNIDLVVAAAQALAARYPALLVEVKPGAVAVHYRQAPELEHICLDAMTQALSLADGMVLLRGKMVVELKPHRASKGLAVRSFLQDDAPFKGRCPWFIGDDVTDEAAFEAVQSMRGVAIKIGAGETLAQHRLDSPAELRRWLDAAVDTALRESSGEVLGEARATPNKDS
jgi:trehalose 6-phosphate phosphatase